jgi:hypothetical protein
MDVDGELIFNDIKKKFDYAQTQWGVKVHDIKKIAMTPAIEKQFNLSQFRARAIIVMFDFHTFKLFQLDHHPFPFDDRPSLCRFSY